MGSHQAAYVRPSTKSDQQHNHHLWRVRRWLATILFYPALLLVLLPLLQVATAQAQDAAATAATATAATLVDGDPIAAPSGSVNLGSNQNNDLATLSHAIGMLDATMSGYRRLNINAVDKAQFNSYLAVSKYAAMLSKSTSGSAPKNIIDAQGNIDVSKLPAATRAQYGLDNLSVYSRQIIQSILNEVTPTATGGAGHEFANVFRITKDFRNKKNAVSNESVPQLDEEPRESQHANGKAIDVSQLDSLRGTQFTIETTVDAKTGKPVIKDGKPVEKVVSTKHIGVQPIDFSLQDKAVAGAFPGAVPSFYGATPHGIGQQLSGKQFGSALNQEINKRGDVGFDTSQVDLSNVQNLGEAAQLYGGAAIASSMGSIDVQLGPNAPLRTGQAALSQGTDLPSYGFYGQSLDGAPNGQSGLLINMGKATIERKLLLAPGALNGSTSDELFTSAGQATFGVALGNLPPGTLSGITNGDRRSLEVHVGRGLLAQRLSLDVNQLPLGASTADFDHALGFQLEALRSAPLAYDTSFGIRESGATEKLVAGTLSADDYLQQIGAQRLTMLEAYRPNRADAALNLEERPNLVTDLENLPSSPDPGTSSSLPLTAAESSAAAARASFLLDQFSFTQTSTDVLNRAKNGDTSTELRFILNHDELQAWLLDNAYAKGVDANQPTKVSRFLAADTAVFYDTGTDQIAKTLGKENTQRAALRSYFRTGVMPTLSDKVTPVVDINSLVGQVDLRSRAAFEAVFRGNAPLPVFETVGRRSLLTGFGQNQADLIDQAVGTTSSRDEITTRLGALLTATNELEAVTTGDVHDSLGQATAVIQQLTTSVNDVLIAGQVATPQAWIGSLTNLYQVGQAAAGVSDQHLGQYRNYALALADLAEGDSSRGLYALGDASSYYINSPVGQAAAAGFVDVFAGTASPNTAIRNFGNAAISQVNGLDSATSQLMFDLLGAATTQRNATTADIRASLTTFATDHQAELAEAASVLELQTYGYDLDGKPLTLADTADARKAAMANAMVALLVEGSGGPSSMRIGSNVLDTGLGIRGYQVSEQGYGTWGMLSTDINGTVERVMQQAIDNEKILELLTNQTNADLTLAEQGNLYEAAALRYGLAVTGFPGNPRMITDPNYQFSMDELINTIEWGTGQSIDQFIAQNNIPLIGDVIADRTLLRSIVNGNFLANQTYLSYIDQSATQAGVPSGFIRTLFDRNLTGEQRTTQLGNVFSGYIQNQVTPDRINELFGFQGTGFESIGQGATGAISILLNGAITDKNTALQGLGTQIGDSYFAANFGTPISWLWSDSPSTSKIANGLTIFTQASGMDPAIGGLAQTFYKDFFVGNGIDTSTQQGRTELANLINATAAAAHLPPEFALLAPAINGDIQGSITAAAGQQFTETLAANGITDVRLGDVLQAAGAPSAATTHLASATAWNEVVGDKDPATLAGGGATVEMINPNTGETVRVAAGTATSISDHASALIGKATATAQTNLKYALGDSLLNQALGAEAGGAINARGMTKAMLTGTLDQKATALTNVMAQLTNSPEAAQIFGGIGTARELATYFGSTAKDAVLAPGALAQAENWFSSATGLPTPAGSMSAMLSFARTHDVAAFNNLVSPTSLVQNFGGYLDQGLGLPPGTTQLAYQASEVYNTAQAAVELAQQQVDALGSAITQNAQVALDAAQLQLSLTTANLVATGVSLVFGKQIAAVDGALGLPQGTASMLVTAGITALMVPGITFAILASSVFLPALAGMLIGALLSGRGLGSLFGGGTKKITRTETLWSYRISDPAQRAIAQKQAKGVDPNTIKQYDGKELSENDAPANVRGAYFKPSTALDRGDWPEEAWFVDADKPGDSARKPNIIAPGRTIALLTDKQLPVDIFRGNTQQQFLQHSRLAAKKKISDLLSDLLTINQRIFTLDAAGKPVNDPSVFPAEIWTHDKADLVDHQTLIDTVYGQGHVGTYQDWIKSGFRRGVGYDLNISLLVRWVHWQY